MSGAAALLLGCCCETDDNLCVTPCTDLYTGPSTLCPLCPSISSTPRVARLTLVNVQTLCFVRAGKHHDLNGVLLNGTWDCVYVGGCRWDFTDTTLTQHTFDLGGDATLGDPLCTTIINQVNTNPLFSVLIGGTGVRVIAGPNSFDEATPFISGQKTYTLPNSVSPAPPSNHGSTGGYALVVFCP